AELSQHIPKVLGSPDALPDGVTLVIPDAGRTDGTAPPANTPAGSSPSPKLHHAPATRSQPAGETTDPAASNSPVEKLRFAPVGRGAFSAGRTLPGSQSSTSSQ